MWGKPWPTLWPILWPTLWPTGGQFFLKTWLSIALNLCKQRTPSICHIYGSLLSSWRRFSQIFRVNTTFREISYERAIIIKHLP